MRAFLLRVLTCSLILTGCSSTTGKRAPLNLSDPAPIQTKVVEWHIVSKDACEIDPKVENGVLFGLSETGYKNLAENMRSIINFMILQKKVIDHYRVYYEGTKPTEKLSNKTDRSSF